MKRLKLITLVALVLLLIVFVLQNIETVSVHFLIFSFGVPKAILFFVLLLVGFAIGVFVGQKIRGKKRRNKPT